MSSIRFTRIAAAMLAATFALTACSDDPVSEAAPEGESDFTSFKPGDSGAADQSSKSAGEGGATSAGGSNDGGQTVTVEEGDVARLWGKDKLLILNRWRGLQVVDIATPAKPKLIGTVPMHGVPMQMYVSGGKATVLLSQAHSVEQKTDGGAKKLVTWAGSEVRVVDLKSGKDAKQVGMQRLDGWISKSLKVGGKLVVVTSKMGWDPWYWGGCWGPYPCAGEATAKGGTTVGVSTGGGAAAGDAAIGYPGGYGWGAASGEVVSLDQAADGKLSVNGKAAFDGGVAYAFIDKARVVVVGSNYSYDSKAKKSWRTDRLTEITLEAGAKPKVAAKWSDKAESKAGALYFNGAYPLADGRIVVMRRGYTNGKTVVALTAYKAAGGKWATGVHWTLDKVPGPAVTTEKDGPGKDGSGKDGSGKDGSGKDGSGKDGDQKIALVQYVQRAAVTGNTMLLALRIGVAVDENDGGTGGKETDPKPGKDEPPKKGDNDGGKSPGGDPDGDDPEDKGDTPSGGGSGSSGGSAGSPVEPHGPMSYHTRVAVLDLTDASTVTIATTVDLEKGFSLGGTAALRPMPEIDAGLVLLEGGKYDGGANTRRVDVLDVRKPKSTTVIKGLSWGGLNTWWSATEVLDSGMLLIGTHTKAKSPKNEPGGGGEGGREPIGPSYSQDVHLVTLAKDGKLKEVGAYKTALNQWSQLRTLDTGKLLLRAGNMALEIIDRADLSKPKYLAKLELAADVRDVATTDKTTVALVRSWLTNKTTLRTLKTGSADEMDAQGSIEATKSWGRMYSHGDHVYLASSDGIAVYDVTDPAKPKARGAWKPTKDGNSYWYFNASNLPQKGSTLFAIDRQGKFVPDDPTKCSKTGVGGTSGGSSGSAGGGSAGSPPKTDTETPKSGGGDDGGSKEEPGGKNDDPDEKPNSEPDKGEPSNGTHKEPGQHCTGKTEWTTNVRAISMADADKPAVAGTLKLDNVPWYWGGKVSGSTLYVTRYQWLKDKDGKDDKWYGKYWLDRIDVTDPAKMATQKSINVPGRVLSLSDDGKWIYTADVTTKKGTKAADYKVESSLSLLKLHKGKAYVQATTKLPGHAGATLVVGDTVYVATWPYHWDVAKGADGKPKAAPNYQLHAYDGSSGKELKQAWSMSTGGGVTALHGSSKHLFAGIGWSTGLVDFDVSKPLAPTFNGYKSVRGYAWRVVTGKDAVYIPAGYYGLTRHKL